MRKSGFLIFLAIIVVITMSAFGEMQVPYSKEALNELSIDQLLELKELISDILTEKGYVLYREIGHGDKGDEVMAIQEKLKEYGFYTGNINGKFDSSTQKAVKSFQKANGIDATGVATRETQTLLFSRNAESKVTPTP